jgi:hypothetical protein
MEQGLTCPTVEDAPYDAAPLRRKAERKAAEPHYRAEADVVGDVINYIRSLPLGHARKIHGDAHTQIGEPDVDACVRGRSVKLEGKTRRDRPTATQMQAMKRWRKAGALTGWFRSTADVVALLEHLDDPAFVANLEQPGCGCPLHPRNGA